MATLTHWPAVGPLTQGFGENSTRDPAFQRSEAFRIYGDYQPHGHGGGDVGAKRGSAVVAAGPGVLDFSGAAVDMPWWVAVKYMHAYGELAWPSGNCAMVDHGGGLGTTYSHLLDVAPIPDGARVAGGERLGGVGSTGRSTGDHLHFETTELPAPNDGVHYGRTDPLLHFPPGWIIQIRKGGEGGAATTAARQLLIPEGPGGPVHDLYLP